MPRGANPVGQYGGGTPGNITKFPKAQRPAPTPNKPSGATSGSVNNGGTNNPAPSKANNKAYAKAVKMVGVKSSAQAVGGSGKLDLSYLDPSKRLQVRRVYKDLANRTVTGSKSVTVGGKKYPGASKPANAGGKVPTNKSGSGGGGQGAKK